MDATLIFEMKRIKEELHEINSNLKRIAKALEEDPEDKKAKVLRRFEDTRRWEEAKNETTI